MLDTLKNSRRSVVIFSLFFVVFDQPSLSFFFFFNDTATTEIYTLSLHDALPISSRRSKAAFAGLPRRRRTGRVPSLRDRKSTRLNSSHANISYAVFCLKKKKMDQLLSDFECQTLPERANSPRRAEVDDGTGAGVW